VRFTGVRPSAQPHTPRPEASRRTRVSRAGGRTRFCPAAVDARPNQLRAPPVAAARCRNNARLTNDGLSKSEIGDLDRHIVVDRAELDRERRLCVQHGIGRELGDEQGCSFHRRHGAPGDHECHFDEPAGASHRRGVRLERCQLPHEELSLEWSRATVPTSAANSSQRPIKRRDVGGSRAELRRKRIRVEGRHGSSGGVRDGPVGPDAAGPSRWSYAEGLDRCRASVGRGLLTFPVSRLVTQSSPCGGERKRPGQPPGSPASATSK